MSTFDIDLVEQLLEKFASIEDRTALRLRSQLMDSLAPSSRPGTGTAPTEPTVGYSPFAPATLIASGAVDFAAIAAGLISTIGGAPHVGLVGLPGVASKLNRSDHAHPAQLDLSVGVAGSANYLARHKLLADTLYRLAMGLTAADEPGLGFGPGGAGVLDVLYRRSGTRQVTLDDPSDANEAIQTRISGPVFARGPKVMDLAIGYAGPGQPNSVVRTDDVGAISTTTINYSGAQVSSVVTTRFGKTITVTPTYTGSDITAIHRAVA